MGSFYKRKGPRERSKDRKSMMNSLETERKLNSKLSTIDLLCED